MIYDTRKVPRWLTEKLLVARDFWCSKANTDSVMVLGIKSVVRSTTREHVKQKYVVASPLMRILWNKDSDSGLTGFVFENICAKVVLYDFWCNRCLFNVFHCLSNVILCLFNAIFHLLNSIYTFLTQFCAFLSRNLILEKIYRKKLSKADISAIFKLSAKLSIST